MQFLPTDSPGSTWSILWPQILCFMQGGNKRVSCIFDIHRELAYILCVCVRERKHVHAGRWDVRGRIFHIYFIYVPHYLLLCCISLSSIPCAGSHFLQYVCHCVGFIYLRCHFHHHQYPYRPVFVHFRVYQIPNLFAKELSLKFPVLSTI